MKKFLIIVLISTLKLASQNTEPVFTLKPALGINGCQIHGDNYSGFNKAGIFGGAAVNARLGPKSSLEMGFYFSQKGARHNQNPEKGDYSFYFVNLNYIDLPLSYRRYLNKDYFITVGPSMAYLINYHEETERGDWTGVYPFEDFEYGINFGLGKKIKDKFFVEVRTSNSIGTIRPYGSGFTSTVYYSNIIAQSFNKGLYNNILTFFVAYKIDIKKKTSAPTE
ncbi:MAG: hypothetical protein K0S32_3537 [Bacteroidetes bacterium]|nr:hypothetical protein [Bacteroidota bacterium]